MPRIIPSDLLQLAKRCELHWKKVNAALDPKKPLTLRRGYDREAFVADIDALEKRLAASPDIDNAHGIALGERDARKPTLKTRLRKFRAAVEKELGDTPFAAEIPLQPETNATEDAFLKVFDDMENLWTRIDAAEIPGFEPPLTMGRVTVDAFRTELAAQRTAYDRTRETIADAEAFRAGRDREVKALWERIRQYRNGCVALLDEGDDLLQTLP